MPFKANLHRRTLGVVKLEMVIISSNIYILYICIYVRGKVGRTDFRKAQIVYILETVSDGIFRSIIDEGDENDRAKLSALMNTTRENFLFRFEKVSKPRYDLTSHTKITQLLNNKYMVDAV